MAFSFRRTGAMLAMFFALGSAAPAQVDVSVYGGYVGLEGPRWIGHGINTGAGIYDIVFDKTASGFYGLSIRSERGVSPILNGIEFYFEGLSAREMVAAPAGSTVAVRTPSGTITQTASTIAASSVFKRARHEFGLRKTFLDAGAGWQFFAVPFFGAARDENLVVSENASLKFVRNNNVRWHYGGVDAGIGREIAISQGITIVAQASLGAYLAVARGRATIDHVLFGVPSGITRSLNGDRWGYRAQGSIELKKQINTLFSASLLGQAVFWSDVPHASFASNNTLVSPGPIRLGYSDMTEFRLLVKLTTKIGATR